jgi:hypothetical protein
MKIKKSRAILITIIIFIKEGESLANDSIFFLFPGHFVIIMFAYSNERLFFSHTNSWLITKSNTINDTIAKQSDKH